MWREERLVRREEVRDWKWERGEESEEDEEEGMEVDEGVVVLLVEEICLTLE